MRSLVSVGGLHVPGDQLRDLELNLDALCEKTGFPKGEEFKWSPGPGQWMREDLVEAAREQFLLEALEIGAAAKTKAIVVIEDTHARKVAKGSASHEEDWSGPLHRCHPRPRDFVDASDSWASSQVCLTSFGVR
jgi:hypothetical protein